MMQRARRIGFGLFTTLAIAGFAGQAPAADERFGCAAFSADGRFALLGGPGGFLRVWGWASQESTKYEGQSTK